MAPTNSEVDSDPGFRPLRCVPEGDRDGLGWELDMIDAVPRGEHSWLLVVAPAQRHVLADLGRGDQIVARRPDDHMRAVVLDVVDDGFVVEVEAF